MRKFTLLAMMLVCVFVFASCRRDAQVASENISHAADNFELQRRVVFYNEITGSYILTVERPCSIGNASTGRNAMFVICKTGPTTYKKHFLGLSDNVTYFAEQLESAPASVYRYRVAFKPSIIVPDVEMR